MSDIIIKQHPDGTRYIRVSLGKGRRVYHRFPASYSEEECLEEARQIIEGAGSYRLGDLLDEFIAFREKIGNAPNTLRTYRTRRRMAPSELARMDVREIETFDLDRVYTAMLADGRSASTVMGFQAFLRVAFSWMEKRRGILTRRPTDEPLRLDTGRRDVDAVGLEDIARIDAMCAEEIAGRPEDSAGLRRRSAAMAIYIALHTGARRGEICALRTSDVIRGEHPALRIKGNATAQRGVGAVRGKTKTRKNRRVALLPADVGAIDRYLAWPEKVGRCADGPLITVDGKPMNPDLVGKEVAAIFDGMGLPKEIRLHALRHAHASTILANGGDVRTVAARLGHARPSTTLDWYAEVMAGRDEELAGIFEDATRGQA